ncbi:MAG TPA: MBL fold metallo-hydrolase, partial [Ktedonobacterales bacterium]|nr:MBL fold metallo-hydrolase [Ktedonobacterales bacterium]
SAYLVGSRAAGEAVLIDPLRDIEQYLARAEELGLRVTSALETHIHNDFVSGAREAVQAVGARLGASARAGLEYPYTPLSDGDTVEAGLWRLRVVATPGHTPEHVSYLLSSKGGTPEALFSGGSLMVGSIARPDLLGPSHTPAMARAAWETLRERLLVLPDEVTVYPTHGGGSFCAAGQSDERVTSIGHERRHNPLAQAQTYRQFLSRYLGPLGSYPAYYQYMRAGNRRGYPLLGRSAPPLRPLTPQAVEAALASGATLVDVRRFTDYDTGHIPNSLTAGMDGPLSAWVGWVLPPDAPIILLGASTEDEREAQIELLRIGFDNILGALEGGIAAWMASGRQTRQTRPITMAQVASAMERSETLEVVDSREPGEWADGHVPSAVLAPANQIPHLAETFPRDIPLAVHCEHGYRSAIAASLLERAGLDDLLHVTDGYAEWRGVWK